MIRVVKLQVMLVAEVLPNIISYNSALRAVQSAHWSIALILFESMVRNRQVAGGRLGEWQVQIRDSKRCLVDLGI